MLRGRDFALKYHVSCRKSSHIAVERYERSNILQSSIRDLTLLKSIYMCERSHIAGDLHICTYACTYVKVI
jgi:hypothetical protein